MVLNACRVTADIGVNDLSQPSLPRRKEGKRSALLLGLCHSSTTTVITSVTLLLAAVQLTLFKRQYLKSLFSHVITTWHHSIEGWVYEQPGYNALLPTRNKLLGSSFPHVIYINKVTAV